MAKPKSVKALVEDQSAAVRKLARTLRKRIESGDYGEHDRKIIDACADMLDSVADGMTEKVNSGDRDGLHRFWKMSAKAALIVGGSAGFLSGVGQGLGTAAFDYFTGDDEIAACVVEITNTTNNYETNIVNWDPNAPSAGPNVIEGSASATLGPMTAEAHGTVSPAQPTGTDEVHAAYDDGLQASPNPSTTGLEELSAEDLAPQRPGTTTASGKLTAQPGSAPVVEGDDPSTTNRLSGTHSLRLRIGEQAGADLDVAKVSLRLDQTSESTATLTFDVQNFSAVALTVNFDSSATQFGRVDPIASSTLAVPRPPPGKPTVTSSQMEVRFPTGHDEVAVEIRRATTTLNVSVLVL